MELFQNRQQEFARDLSRAMMQTLSSSSKRTERTLDFDNFVELVRGRSRNLTRDKNEDDGLPKARQQVYPNYDQDLWNIWNFFENEGGDYSQSKLVASTLFDRKIISYNQDLDCKVILNYSGRYIFRDTNIAISVVDNQNREVGLIGFFILPDGVVEIFQLQCKQKYGANDNHFKLLIEEARRFLGGLGFKKMLIISSERLFITNTPTVLPGRVSNEHDMEVWMQKHRLHMKLTYDVNPIRKWGFHKPELSRNTEGYSGEMYL